MAERNPFAQYKIRRVALELRSFTVNELSSATDTTSQTIYGFIHELKEAGEGFYSTEDLPSADSGPGRPPVRYHLSPQGLEFLASQNSSVARGFNEAAFAADPSLRPASRRSRKSPGAAASPRTLRKGLSFKGEITGAEDFEIDGSVEGLIGLAQSKVTVLATGEVRADIIAREIVIYGKVQGNVRAKELVSIKKDGSLSGDITTARLMIEDGAFFKGSIEIDRSSAGEFGRGSPFKKSEYAEAAGARNRTAQSH
jgi:cytoskeletal protein CcmA (bactofilin family)